MSVCRFSDMNGYSEVYVYESEEGYVTHVASKRRTMGAPFMDYMALLSGFTDEMYDEMKRISKEWAEANPPEELSHPEAGAVFCHETASECYENLSRLKKSGVIVPYTAELELLMSAQEKEEDNG